MNKKITITLIACFFVLSIKAQEPLIVRGQLELSGFGISDHFHISDNFKQGMFCYFNGNFIARNTRQHGSYFFTLQVDSVISGSFPTFGEPPFSIPLALINESVVLNLRESYTLRIRQFPYTNNFYIDSLSQVYPNEHLAEKFAQFHENHQQNVRVFTEGTLQERHDFLRTSPLFHLWRDKFFIDFRYLSYLIPYMASNDTIISYWIQTWSGTCPETGWGIGGEDIIEYEDRFSNFLYNHLSWRHHLRFLSSLPGRNTDSIGWHKWHESLFQRECFSSIRYAQVEHKVIVENIDWFFYFIVNSTTEKIHFSARRDVRRPRISIPYVLSINTGELIEKKLQETCTIPRIPRQHSSQGNEIAFGCWGLELATLTDGVFCVQQISPLYEARNHLVIHSNDNFWVFYIKVDTDRPPGQDFQTYLKAGKMDRKGEWIIEPSIFYRSTRRHGFSNSPRIEALFLNRVAENEILLAFSDGPFFIYKMDEDLNRTDSIVLTLDDFFEEPIPRFSFSETYLLKKDSVFLLLAQVNRNRLFYRLLHNNLEPKTNFIELASSKRAVAQPIVTSEGFMITWVDNDLTDGLLRSVLIDKSGRQSNIINITNQQAGEFFNVEVDKNTVDIYIHCRQSRSLIRKRIAKKEYW